MDLREFFNPRYVYAVVGATDNGAKYGYKVFRDLCSAGWRVVPVNPKRPIVDGVQAVTKLSEASPKPDVVVFVVPPPVGLVVLDEVAQLGLQKLWFQPGAESEEIRLKIKDLGLRGVTDGSCIMVERKRFGPDRRVA